MTAFAREDAGDREKLNSDLDKIETSGNFLLSLVNDILDISRIDSGRMSYLTEKMDISEEAKQNLKKIDTSSKFLLSLINDVLDMSKAESGKMELHPEPYPPEAFFGYIDAVIRPLCREKNQKLILDDVGIEGIVPVMRFFRVNGVECLYSR